MPYQGIKPAGRVPRLNRSHPHARGLAAFYVFHEGGGLTVTDLVSGIQGTLTSGPTWTPSRAPGGGYGVDFTAASTQYIDLGQPAPLDFSVGGDISVAASYYLKTVPNFTNFFIGNRGSQWALDVEGPSTGARFYTNNGSGGGFFSESRAPVAGDTRVIGGAVSVNQQIGYLCVEGIAPSASSVPFVQVPSAATPTRIGCGSTGSGAHNGHINWIALWNRYLPPGLMADFQRDPFACLRTPRRVFYAPPAASGGTTISTTSAISLGASATVVQGISVSASSALSLGSAATITLTSPSISFSTTAALSLGASATVTQGMSFSAASSLSLGASAAATFTTATTISTTSAISLGASAAVTLASAALSISTTSALSLGAAATVTIVGPPTTISTTSALSLGAASTVTLTSPALSISTTSALSLGSSAAVTFTSTGIAFTVSSPISLGSSASVAFTTATTIAATSSLSLGAAATVTFTAAAGIRYPDPSRTLIRDLSAAPEPSRARIKQL